jgi:hypothetical protein
VNRNTPFRSIFVLRPHPSIMVLCVAPNSVCSAPFLATRNLQSLLQQCASVAIVLLSSHVAVLHLSSHVTLLQLSSHVTLLLLSSHVALLLFCYHVAVPHLPLLVALLLCGSHMVVTRVCCAPSQRWPTGVLHGGESLKLLLILGINFGIASLCVDECVTTRKAGVAATWAFGCYVRGILSVVISIVAVP